MFVYWTRNYALRGIQGMLLFALMLYVEGYAENRPTNLAGLTLGVFGIEWKTNFGRGEHMDSPNFSPQLDCTLNRRVRFKNTAVRTGTE